MSKENINKKIIISVNKDIMFAKLFVKLPTSLVKFLKSIDEFVWRWNIYSLFKYNVKSLLARETWTFFIKSFCHQIKNAIKKFFTTNTITKIKRKTPIKLSLLKISFSGNNIFLTGPIFCSPKSFPISKWRTGKTSPIDKISRKAVNRLNTKKWLSLNLWCLSRDFQTFFI